MRRALIASALLLVASTVHARHAEEPDPPPADKAVLAQLEPGNATYGDVVKLLGPPNAVEKIGDGAQQLIYTGGRRPLRQHVGFLFFGWDKETPGAPYRTVVTVDKTGLVESLTAN